MFFASDRIVIQLSPHTRVETDRDEGVELYRLETDEISTENVRESTFFR